MTDDAKPTIPTISPISAADAPKDDAKHRILFTFVNDHDINGMKAEIMGLTPEQCIVAAYHLTRSANQLSDAITIQAMRERAEIDRVRRELEQGGKGKH